MGSGLTRAAQATARSRWDGKLTPEMRSFLGELDRRGGSVRPPAMDRWASSAASAARQRCRHLALVEMSKDDKGRQLWILLPAGRFALAEHGRDALGKGEEGR